MKNLLIVLLLILSSVLVAQTSASTLTLRKYASTASFPTTGNNGTLYVDLSTQLVYHWSGGAYVQLSPSSPPSNPAWELLGNSGTTPLTNYVGTSDASPLSIRTGGIEAIRVAVGGNVGMGTATPTQRLSLVGSLNTNFGAIINNTNAGTTARSTILFQNNASNLGFLAFNSSTSLDYAGLNALTLSTLAAHPVSLGTNNTIQLTVAGSGNVGIGTNFAAPTEKLHIHNISGIATRMRITNGSTGATAADGSYIGLTNLLQLQINQLENSDILFLTAGVDRGRFGNNGSFGVGVTTTPTHRIQIVQASNVSTQGLGITSGANTWAAFNNAGTLSFTYNGALRGTFNNVTGIYTPISDINLKDNIKPANKKAGDILDLLRPVTYTFKGDSVERVGLIAQEVEEVYPNAVETHTQFEQLTDSLGEVIGDEKIGEIKTVDYNAVLMLLLIEVKALRDRIAILEK